MAIKKFLEKHPDLRELEINRVLHLNHNGCYDTYIIQAKKSVFIFEYSCGILECCRTERETFDSYFKYIPTSLYSEYIVF